MKASAESDQHYVYLEKTKSIKRSRPGLKEILIRTPGFHICLLPSEKAPNKFATFKTTSIKTMHFPHFNSLIAAMVLFGMVTAAPVPQEDDLSISVPISIDLGTL